VETTSTVEHRAAGHHAEARLLGTALAALGIVFGDIGTSPLYALRECFSGEHAVRATPANVLGVLSLIFWALVFTVSLEYLVFVMRADNRGEGGIMALISLVRPEGPPRARRRALIAVGLFGAALLYGDGMITPAISVLSAMEGIGVAAHGILRDPEAARNPFYLLAPSWGLYPLVALAAAATVTASQAVISGAFSLTRQAVQLGYSPRLHIEHTSGQIMGQIYVPLVNWGHRHLDHDDHHDDALLRGRALGLALEAHHGRRADARLPRDEHLEHRLAPASVHLPLSQRTDRDRLLPHPAEPRRRARRPARARRSRRVGARVRARTSRRARRTRSGGRCGRARRPRR
jgi:hypothetical protein